jgi:Fur family ferric uptake transcriptional regulator
MVSQLTKTQSNIDDKFNRRSTEQRRLIMEIIRQAEGHLDADEIYQQARQKSPSISLSTVYRSLQLFKESELIEEHQFDGMRRYYETTPRSKHRHLVCLGCGRIFEFKCPSTERLKSKIRREEGFKVTDAEVRLAGYCPECQQRFSNNMTDTKQQVTEGR